MSSKSDALCRWTLILGGAVAMLAVTWIGVGSLNGPGEVFCLVSLLLFWVAGSLCLLFCPLFQRPEHTICAILGLYLCLFLRLCLFDYISPDYVSFLSQWTQAMRNMTVRQVLTTPIGDYNMPYLYLLLLISRLKVYDLYCIKLWSVLADVLLAVAAGKLAKLLTRREGLVLGAFLGALLAPTMVLNSAYWGQCDGIYACFCLWGLYCGLTRRPIRAMALLACGFAFKLQAVFLLPIAAFLLVRGNLRLRELAVFPLTFLVIMLPALLAGRSFGDTFGIYLDQTAAYPYLSLNAPSLWSLIPNDYFSQLDPAPVVLAGIVTLLLLYGFLRRYRVLSNSDLIALSLIFTLAIPWLLPRMHERYFYLAEVLSIIYVIRWPRQLPVALVLLGGGFLAYCSYLFGGMRILTNELVAAIYGLTLIYLIVTLLRRTERRAATDTNMKEDAT